MKTTKPTKAFHAGTPAAESAKRLQEKFHGLQDAAGALQFPGNSSNCERLVTQLMALAAELDDVKQLAAQLAE